jgi:hypothetical protein
LKNFSNTSQLFGPFLQCKLDQSLPVFHQHPKQIVPLRHYSVQHPDYPLGRDIQVNFYHQRFKFKIIYHIESPKAYTTEQRIMQKSMGQLWN